MIAPQAVLAAMLLATASATAGSSARLTLVGYMPPRQQVMTIQSATATAPGMLRVEIRNNSASNPKVMADWLDTRTGNKRTANLRVTAADPQARRHGEAGGFPAGMMRPSAQPSSTHVEIEPPPSSPGCCLRLTIASQ